MQVSARNLIPGKVKSLSVGMVAAEVVVEIAPGVEMVSVITKNSVEKLDLKEGSPVNVMVKATSVMLVTD